jgi:hypothetical protein
VTAVRKITEAAHDNTSTTARIVFDVPRRTRPPNHTTTEPDQRRGGPPLHILDANEDPDGEPLRAAEVLDAETFAERNHGT